MKTNLGGPPESVVKALSKPNGKNVAQAAGQLLNWASSQTDQALIQRSVLLMRKAISVVKEALPDTDPELIGGFFADLLDLWEAGQKLDKELKELCKLRFPQHRERLRDLLIEIKVHQLDEPTYWIGEVEKDLPKLLKALDGLERRSIPGKQKRRLPRARAEGKPKRSQRSATVPADHRAE